MFCNMATLCPNDVDVFTGGDSFDCAVYVSSGLEYIGTSFDNSANTQYHNLQGVPFNGIFADLAIPTNNQPGGLYDANGAPFVGSCLYVGNNIIYNYNGPSAPLDLYLFYFISFF